MGGKAGSERRPGWMRGRRLRGCGVDGVDAWAATPGRSRRIASGILGGAVRARGRRRGYPRYDREASATRAKTPSVSEGKSPPRPSQCGLTRMGATGCDSLATGAESEKDSSSVRLGKGRGVGRAGRTAPTDVHSTVHTAHGTVHGVAFRGAGHGPQGLQRAPPRVATGPPQVSPKGCTAAAHLAPWNGWERLRTGASPGLSALSVRTTPQRRRNGRPTWCRPSWSRGCARFSPL